LKPADLESTLQRKFGFAPAEHRSVDHRWFQLNLPNLPSVLTKISHSSKEIGPKLEGIIAKQLRVRQKVFKDMIGCTVNKEEYYEKLRTESYPPFF